MPRASHPSAASGQLLPPWIWVVLGVVLIGLMYVVLGSDPVQPDPIDPIALEETQPEGGDGPESPLDQAVVEAEPTPTWLDGSLVAELRFLGGFEQEKIRPKRAGGLEGRVLDHNGEPIGGVRLRIMGGPQDGWSTLSKEGGSYYFPELLPGTHYFELDVPGFGRAVRSQRVQMRGITQRDFQVAPKMGVDLEIRNHENKPLAGAKLIADLNGIETLSDENGIARLLGVVGGSRVLVTVRADGHVPVRVELNLRTQPSNAAPIAVPPLPKGGVIQGVVRSWPGNPLPQISIVPRSDRIGSHRYAWETWQGIEVGSDGRFRLENVPTSHLLDIRVFHPRGVAEPAHRAVRPTKEVPTTLSFVIKRGQGHIKGQVIDADGEAIPRAELVLESADPAALLGRIYPGLEKVPSTTQLPVPAAMRRELRADSRGRFEFAVGDHPKGTGSMVLTASAPGFQPRRISITRVHENLKMRLTPEDRSGVLELQVSDSATQAGEPEPQLTWYLDGALAAEQPGYAVDGLALHGLPVGVYEFVLRSGDEVVLQRSELKISGRQRLTLK
jgi:hypothetical protein